MLEDLLMKQRESWGSITLNVRLRDWSLMTFSVGVLPVQLPYLD